MFLALLVVLMLAVSVSAVSAVDNSTTITDVSTPAVSTVNTTQTNTVQATDNVEQSSNNIVADNNNVNTQNTKTSTQSQSSDNQNIVKQTTNTQTSDVQSSDNQVNTISNNTVKTLKNTDNQTTNDNITKETPNIKMDNYTSTLRNNVTLNAKIADNATGIAVFKLNGKTISDKINLVNGTATYVYQLPSNYRAINYTLQVIYSGDDYYTNSTAYSTLSLNKIPTTATLNNITSKPGNTITFESIVTNIYNETVANTTVVFKFGGKTVGNATTDENGKAVFNYVIPTRMNQQSYTINMISKQTSEDLEARQSATVTLTQLATTVTVNNITTTSGKTVTVTGIVKDENNNPVLSGKAVIKINGKTLATVTVSNGIVNYNYTVPYSSATIRNISITYANNTKYGGSTSNGYLTINILGTQTSINNITTKPGKTALLNATVIDANGNAVNGGVVVFKINGTTVGQANVNNGQAVYSYNVSMINAGKSTITATYTTNSKYNTSSQNSVLIINKLNTNVSTNNQNTTVGQAVTSTVTVIDELGNNVTSGIVTFYINGSFIKRVNVTNGVASVTYNPSLKLIGTTVQVNAIYSGNGIYNASTSTSNLTINKLSNVYVSNSGSDSNLGTQSSPFKTLSYALSHVASAGTINLAKGTYTTSGLVLNDSVLIKGVTISTTIIDGQNSGKTIFTLNNTNAILSIANLTLTNGKSTNNNSAGAIVSNGKLSISNTLFKSNVAIGINSSGAIYSTNVLSINSSRFTSNSATTDNSVGGAIRNTGSTIIIMNSYFNDNKAIGSNSTGGGAVYVNNGNLYIVNSEFVNNLAKGKSVTGGAVEIVTGNITVTNGTFTSNSVNGTTYGLGGAIGDLDASIYLINSTFTKNIAISSTTAGAGALYAQYCILVVTNTLFENNQAVGSGTLGGAVYNYYVYSSMENTKFIANSAKASNSGNALGGAINYNLGTLTANNLTFTNNVATGNSTYGGAIYFAAQILSLNASSFTGNNATAKSSAAGGAVFAEGNTTITHSLLQNNRVIATANGGGAIASTGNLTATYNNFISNVASAAGSAISNGGTVVSIENNYWGVASPTWSGLLYNANKPSKYSRTYINN